MLSSVNIIVIFVTCGKTTKNLPLYSTLLRCLDPNSIAPIVISAVSEKVLVLIPSTVILVTIVTTWIAKYCF